jgi:hypothetical protein
MKKDNENRWHLLMLLVKLDLFPFIAYEGKIYPATLCSNQYKEWARELR